VPDPPNHETLVIENIPDPLVGEQVEQVDLFLELRYVLVFP